MKKTAILSTSLLLAMNSCSNEEIFNEDSSAIFERQISVVAEDLTSSNGTRTTYTEGETGYHFAWTEGDALGIFPVSGHQTDFPISNGYGTNTAVFDGGKWALRPNESYAAYYPLIHDFDLDPTAIPVDYTGQVQSGNGSTAHLGKYDFMASTFSEVDAKGNVNFHLQHLGCLVQFNLAMPEVDSYSALEITSDNTPFITSGNYSLFDAVLSLANTHTSNKVTIGLSNISTTAGNKAITITAMFAPVDLSDSKLTLEVTGGRGFYIFEVDGQDLSRGMMISKESNSSIIPYITFHADEVQTLTMSKAVATLEYSVNNGTWINLGTNTVNFGGTIGDLRLRGKSSTGTAQSTSNYSQIKFGFKDIKVSCSGDIRTLVDYENHITADTSNARFCRLFSGCSSLTCSPKLPAITLASDCYSRMFYSCSSLTCVSKLPASTLASGCYNEMFRSCSSLTVAPELPATTLARSCYSYMFNGCSSLIGAPELPAKELKGYCYYYMFAYCHSLTSAPELPAKELIEHCYSNMFAYCESLNYVKMMATTTPYNSYNQSWLEGVSGKGTFVKNSAATWSNSGVVPSGWTVETAAL